MTDALNAVEECTKAIDDCEALICHVPCPPYRIEHPDDDPIYWHFQDEYLSHSQWGKRIRAAAICVIRETKLVELSVPATVEVLLCGKDSLLEIGRFFLTSPRYEVLASELKAAAPHFSAYRDEDDYREQDDEKGLAKIGEALDKWQESMYRRALSDDLAQLRVQLRCAKISTEPLRQAPSATVPNVPPNPLYEYLPRLPSEDQIDGEYHAPLLIALLDAGAINYADRQKQSVIENAATKAGLGIRSDCGRDWQWLRDLGLTDSSTGGTTGGVWLTNIGAAMAKWLQNR
jgi:hypothetical protein